jgi:predicted PurR-regulated permease PerM
MQGDRRQDLARIVFQLLALGTLIVTSFWIVRPFLIAFAWAAMIVVATWPLLLSAQKLLGGRRSLAVVLMTIVLLLVLVVPLYFGIASIVDNAKYLAEAPQLLTNLSVPQLPVWVESLPLVGSRIAAMWQQIASGNPEELSARFEPYARTLAIWFVGQVGGIGLLLVQFLLTVLIAAILYAKGETAASTADRLAARLAGSQGTDSVRLAAMAIRGVALGVVVTAIVQSSLAGIGLAIFGVPFAAVLTVLTFICCIAQLGPGLVLIPAVIWVYSTQSAVWGTAFLIWSILCSVLDNFLRPILIRRGADLPLLLIFAGVIGGLIAFGIIGLFVGPVVLAVAYTLLSNWLWEGAPATDG